jgi:hypothetical protein
LLPLLALCLLLTGCDFAIGDADGDRRQVRLELVVRNEGQESFQLEVRPIENGEVAGGGWNLVQGCSIGSGFQEISPTWFLYLWPDRAWEGDEGTEIYNSARVNEQDAVIQLRVEIDEHGEVAVRPGRLRPNEPPGGELDNC